MKILYGIQGTGNGHISRCRMMAKYLSKTNFDVTYLISGREKEKLFDMDVFGNFLHRDGLTFVTNNGKIDTFASAKTNNIFKFISDIRNLDVSEYDLIITDFEPITAWAAKRAKKPTLAIGHQYAFGPGTPIEKETFIAKKILQHFAPADTEIGLHWSDFDENVLPPIVDASMQGSPTDDSIIVYLPFENQHNVISMLQQIPTHQFIMYSPLLNDSESLNVSIRKTSYQGFKRDLKKAAGVICNSGFELNSECIHLGIPILTKPIDGQMEQESNALAIKQLNYGLSTTILNQKTVIDWLKNRPSTSGQPYPDVAKKLVDWITSGMNESVEELSQTLWNEYRGTAVNGAQSREAQSL